MAYIKTNWEDLPSEDTPITSANLQKIEDALAGMLDYFYPVGTIYETTSADLDTTTKMANHFGGTWEAYGAGRVLVAKSADTEFDTIGETGGAKTHTLTNAQVPATQIYDNQNNAIYFRSNVAQGGNNLSVISRWGSVTDIALKVNGSGEAHNNLQPYIVVYRYRRTA